MEFAKKILLTLAGILLVYAIVLLGTMIQNNLRSYDTIGYAGKQERTLSVDAEAKVMAVPDTGVVTMGVVVKGDTVAAAQKEGDERMGSLIAALKALGIESADIQTTDYRIYPKIKYTPDKGEEQDGFEAVQSVTVKIRDLGKASAVLELVSRFGVNIVQGVHFVIDDPEVYRTQARDLALQKAKGKAQRLASSLGVRIESVVAYNEYEPGTPPDFGLLYAERGGVGGAPAPAVEQGSAEVVMRVSITYEIRPR